MSYYFGTHIIIIVIGFVFFFSIAYGNMHYELLLKY